MRKDSRELLERQRDAHGDEAVELKAIANPSPSHGLHALAEQEDADLIVVGSTHTGRAGRVLPGSTAERLLHGAPCPVAVAPNGYAQRSDQQPAVIGCGYDGSSSSRRALEEAGRLAAATGAKLQAIRVFEPLLYDLPPGNNAFGGMASYNDALHVRAAEELEAAVARIETAGAESSSRTATLRTSSPTRPRGSTSCSSARAATARCTPSWSVASPGRWCAKRPAP